MYASRCSQRGCVATHLARAPVDCPICNQPLLKGDVIRYKEADTAHPFGDDAIALNAPVPDAPDDDPPP